MRTIFNAMLFAALAAMASGCHAKQPAPAVDATPQQAKTTSLAGAEVVRLDPALDSVIAPGTPIEKVAGGFKFTEGPMWREGRLWFSDVVGNQMLAVSPQGVVTVLMEKAGGLETPKPGSFSGSNAMVTDKDGSVLLLQHGLRRILRLTGADDQLKGTVLLDHFQGKRFNSPNDLVFAPDGALWFTDPPFGLAGQDKDPAKQLPFNGVFRYAEGKLTVAIKDLPRPNGIGFSPDGKTLYVSNSGPDLFVCSYQVSPAGTLSHKKILISYPGPAADVPDGLKIDSAGNLWTTGPGGLRVISASGKVLGQIKLPEVAANVAWADGGRTAYFTATSGIYRLRVVTPGQMPLYVK